MVYLLHFSTPYRHARHYLGFTENIDQRLQAHRSGKGARLIEVISDAGIQWELARVWPDGDRAMERKLKNRHKSSLLCPICQKEKRN